MWIPTIPAGRCYAKALITAPAIRSGEELGEICRLLSRRTGLFVIARSADTFQLALRGRRH